MGILWMLVTVLCFTSLDTLVKHLLETYSLVQVTWARFFFATIVAALAAGKNLPKVVKTKAPTMQLTRSLLLALTTALFNAGIRIVPLATATTIMFLAPILVTVLSVPLLKEHVGPRRWFGVLVGFVGALIVVRPWESHAGLFISGALFLLIAALLNASYQITTRKVRLFDEPLTSMFYTSVIGALVTTVFVPWHWQWPEATDWLLLIGTGLLGGIGHLFLIRAFRQAPASVVAPFSYSSLIWAALFGWLFFAEWPEYWTWLGAALIIGSGLYIFHRERQHRHN
ncbi:EamA family transporter [Aestuariivirga sp. YIM B02566]|uniref:DMT family transporter n=1 Tax=Taklimakanibacter albus TaxID=2800327 RepID=A0ACC5R2F6_9HYPH|nr:DMT family transporter [Aestuariivirga sp. YIM B02566]